MMSRPREVIAGRYYMIQRRCLERRFFLRPGEKTNQTFWYCLGLALQETEVKLVAGVAMSNHHHLVVHDVKGQLPLFMHRFHMLLARSQNCYLGRWENFWSAEQPSRVRLVTSADVIRKAAYVLANPVSAFLVDTAAHWPGATTWHAMKQGRVIVAQRPRHFFRDTMPEQVSIRLQTSPADLTADDFRTAVVKAVETIEAEAAATLRRERRRIVGRSAVCKQSHFARPASQEPRRELAPRVACMSKWHRIEALHQDRAFLQAYSVARARWLAGKKAEFPPGTWALRRFAPTVGPS